MLASAAGIVTTTPGSTHLQAGEHIALTAEGHISLSVGQRLLASAKDGIRFFALKGGMKWITGKGKISVQARKDKVKLTARQQVSIKSTAESIYISAPTKVVINGGGSSTEWSNAGIVHRTLGRWVEHAASHVQMGPKRLSQQMNSWPEASFNEAFMVRDPDGQPVSGISYRITREDGGVFEGVTEADGSIPMQNSISPDGVTIELLGRAP